MAYSWIVAWIVAAIVAAGTWAPLVARYSSESVISLYILMRLGLVALVFGISCWHFLTAVLTRRIDLATIGASAILLVLVVSPTFALAMHPSAAATVWTQFQIMGTIFMPLALVGMFCIAEFSWLGWISKLLVRLGVAVAVVAIIQWVLGYDLLKALHTNVVIGDGGFDAHYGSALDSEGRPIFRAFSTLLNHYDVSAHLVMSMLILLGGFATDQFTRRQFATGLPVMVFGLLVTYNMTAWALAIVSLGLATGIFVLSGHLRIHFWWRIGLGLVVGAFLAMVAGSGFAGRIMQNSNLDLESGSSAASRFIFLYNSLRLIGIEPGGWGWATAQGDLPYAITADNYFLWVSVFGGVWYIALYIGFFLATLLRALASLPGLLKKRPELFGHQVVLFSWIAAATACGLSNFFIAKGFSVVSYFWLSMGLVWAMARQKDCRSVGS